MPPSGKSHLLTQQRTRSHSEWDMKTLNIAHVSQGYILMMALCAVSLSFSASLFTVPYFLQHDIWHLVETYNLNSLQQRFSYSFCFAPFWKRGEDKSVSNRSSSILASVFSCGDHLVITFFADCNTHLNSLLRSRINAVLEHVLSCF